MLDSRHSLDAAGKDIGGGSWTDSPLTMRNKSIAMHHDGSVRADLIWSLIPQLLDIDDGQM